MEYLVGWSTQSRAATPPPANVFPCFLRDYKFNSALQKWHEEEEDYAEDKDEYQDHGNKEENIEAKDGEGNEGYEEE